MRAAGLLLGLVLIAAPARGAEVPRLLADANRAPFQGPSAFLPAPVSGFFQLGDRLLFSTALGADNGILWSTDGTAQGTVQISSSLCVAGCGSLEPLASWHGLGLFRARGLLARTDGTPGGTFLLSPRIAISWELRASDDLPFFFFEGCLPQGGCHLWRGDGSVAGTQLVTATDGLPFDDPEQTVLWHGRLWFVASHGPVYNHGLWSTDGTPEGTTFFHDIVEDQNDGARIEATTDHLFFSTGENGEDLWVTDGTPESTRRLADFEPVYCHPSCSSQDVNAMEAIGGQIYFFKSGAPEHGTTLWRSDGTESGTGPLLELPRGTGWPYGLLKVGDSLLFTVYSPDDDRYRLWTLDSGLTRAEPLSGCEGGSCPAVRFLTRLGPGSLFFQGTDPDHGTEPWITDGTGPGTRRLADTCPGACSGLLADSGSKITVSPSGEAWFQVFPQGNGDLRKDELWTSDGTPAGTRRVWDHFAEVGFLDGRACFGTQRVSSGAVELWAADGPTATPRRVRTLRRFAPGSDPRFQAIRGGAILAASEGFRLRSLWRSDGTAAGTGPIFEFPPGEDRELGDFLGPVGRFQLLRVFHREDLYGGTDEIWRTDGSRDGTWLLHRFDRDEYTSLWTSWAGKVLFTVEDPKSCSIWSSDGTFPGTRELLPRQPGVGCPGALMGFGPRFLFVARTADSPGEGAQLFVSDGTPAGTRQLTFLRHYREADDWGEFVQAGGAVFFRLFHDYTTELWRTDGTVAGTRPLFPSIDAPDDLAVFRGSLYFTVQIGAEYYQRGLYRAPLDGRGEPLLLARVANGSGFGEELRHLEARLTPAGDRLVFIAENGRQGVEPWVTDGTPEGTHLLADLLPGPGSSVPQGLTGGGGKAWFSAWDPVAGEELWETDGTAAGTRRVQDIAPGGLSSSPRNLTVSGDFLFFAADDGKTGVEPWALKLKP